jgi:uncharacterized membrane protein/uncharacterized membrane protein YeaQ/YmgE (transglycosylase-associated protein family)
MRIVIWIITGLLAGWMSRLVMKSRAQGFLGDLILGSLGALVGGAIMRAFGASPPAGHWENFAVALIGAMTLLGAMRLLLHFSKRTGLYRRDPGGATAILDLETHVKRLGALERKVVTKILRREPLAENPNQVFDAQQTFGQRVADRVASFGGSWTFIGLFLLFMLLWMLFNTENQQHFDPFPFILLNLILSCLAALQAPIIMMSQNRQAAKDRLEAQQDYEVNLRAEMEVVALHAKIDELRQGEIPTLLQIQDRQVELLAKMERILAQLDDQ